MQDSDGMGAGDGMLDVAAFVDCARLCLPALFYMVGGNIFCCRCDV